MKRSQNLRTQGGGRRAILVVEENWMPLDDWFLGPGADKNLLGNEWGYILAHKCSDGSIRAPTRVWVYTTIKHGIKLYGKCSNCSAKIGDKVHFLFKLIRTNL